MKKIALSADVGGKVMKKNIALKGLALILALSLMTGCEKITTMQEQTSNNSGGDSSRRDSF